jgi:mitogen-activated protein kinase kinase kinase
MEVIEKLDLRASTVDSAGREQEADTVSDSGDDLFAVKPRRNQEEKQKASTDLNTSPVLEQPIYCTAEGCSAQFERMSDYLLHMKQHGTSELTCEFLDCGKKFYRFEDLKEHVRQEHGVATEITHSLAPLNITKRLVQPNEIASDSPAASEPHKPLADMVQGTSSTGFMRGNLIGVGVWSKARTYLGMEYATGELIVVKEIRFSEDSAQKTAEDGRMRMRRELVDQLIEIVSKLDHPNLIKFHNYSLKNNVYSLLMEYVSGGTLADCTRKYGKFPENMVASFTRQIMQGLVYLHSEGILHRDLTTHKVFMDLDGTCKIGWSFMMEKSDNVYDINKTADRRMGSGKLPQIPMFEASTNYHFAVYWMAPEVVRSEGSSYTGKSDVWSIGCIVLELLSGRRPFSKEEIIGAIFKLGHLSQAPPIPEDVSNEVGAPTLAFIYDCFTM